MKALQRPAAALPLHHKDARTRSDFRVPAYVASIAKRKAQQQALLRNHAKARERELRKHFSKAELKAAARIVARLREEFHAANLELGTDGATWDANKVLFQRRVRQRLAKAFPQVRQWRKKASALERRFATQAFSLSSAASAKATSRLTLAPSAEPAEPVWTKFAAPYTFADVVRIDYDAFPTTSDQSFAIPSIGHVITNVVYEHDESTGILSGLFGWYLPLWAWSRSGVGASFAMPVTGRLKIRFRLKNFITRGHLALTDNFGMSDGYIQAFIKLFVELIHGRAVTTVSKIVVDQKLFAPGEDRSKLLPSLFQGGPYVWTVEIDAVFPAGAVLEFAVGTEFEAFATVDDMKAHIDATIWSEVTQIEVQVVPI